MNSGPRFDAVILTRPAGRNAALAAALQPLGIPVIEQPALAIEPIRSPEARAALQAIEAGDLVFFVSPRAVEQACALHPLTDWPAVQLAAVGRATAAALREQGAEVVIVPAPGEEESEGVLRHPALANMNGRRAWIIRGEGGRNLMRQTLAERGAEVRLVEVYRRICPPMALATLAARYRHPLWVISSPQSLQCLYQRAETAELRDWLLHSALIVINARTESVARAHGFVGPIWCSGGPDDEAMRATVAKVFAGVTA